MMQYLLSKLNIFLVCLNACLMLGVAYLWYPQVSEVHGGVSVSLVQEEDTRNWEQVTSTWKEDVSVEEDTNDELPVTSSTTSTVNDSVEVVLPPEMNLAVPFTSQAPEGNWEQPWQDACEEATILMLDAYYKTYNLSPLFAKDELQKMVDWESAQSWGYSIPIAQVKETLDWYMGRSFISRIIENPSIGDIKKSVANGNPVLVVAYGKSLDNPNFRNGGPEYHALIIRGYTEEGFITNDPGTRNGKEFFYTYENLMNSIHDWNNGDVEHGKSVVLVVEKK
jgi:hypothetical protein